MLTDSIKIINGDVVNLGVKVNITVSRTSSERKAKISVIDRLGKILSPEQRGFNEPIIKGQITSELNSLDLVQNVKEISFETKINTEEGYAGNDYDIDYATRKRIIYPSKDPSVFTVRYPNKDIEVKNV